MRLPRLRATSAAAAALLVAGALVAPAATAAPSPPDPAGRKKQVDASIGDLRQTLEDTSATLVDAYDALNRTKARLPGARARLVSAEDDVSRAVERDAELGRELALSKAAEAKATDALETTVGRSRSTSSVLGGIAREAYQSNGMGELSVALDARTPDDLATRLVLVDTALRLQGDALSRLSVLRADTAAAQTRLAAVRRQTALLKGQAEANLVLAQEAASAAALAKAAVDALTAARSQQVVLVGQRKADENRRLAALQVQSQQLGAQLAEIARQARIRAAREKAARELAARRAREAAARVAAARAAAREAAREEAARQAAQEAARQAAREAARQAARQSADAATRRAGQQARRSGDPGGSTGGAGDPAPSPGGFVSSGYLSAPVRGAYVSSEFGMRFHPILHTWRLHAGIDFAVPCGTPVYAAADGTVISAGWAGGYGNRVVVDNGLIGATSLATTYNHLTSIVVRSGPVSRGQLIAYSGTTGASTGCHLHFETYDDGTPVNPRRWL